MNRTTASKSRASKLPVSHRSSEYRGPALPLRVVGLAALVVGVLVLGPLFTVWKQVHVRKSCIRREVLTDSLMVTRSEIARLRLVAARLSAPARIEEIARNNLGLIHPSPNQVVVISESSERVARLAFDFNWPFLAILKRSLSPVQS